MVSVVALLEFRLALCNETDYFYCSCPCMLNICSVLDLDVEATKMIAGGRVDVVLVNVMNSAIASRFWFFYVVVFFYVVPAFVFKARKMKFLTECVKFFARGEY